MRLESLSKRPLDEEELLLKAIYNSSSDHSLFENAMTFSEYEKHIKDGKIMLTPNSHYYWDESVDQLGTTISEVNSISNAAVTHHRRYTYPVFHNHDYVEVIYVAEGHCKNLFEDYSFEMKRGDVCIMSPNSVHALSCTNDESCILNLMVNKDFFDSKFLSILKGGNVLINYLEKILYQKSSSPYILFPTGKDPWLQDLARHLLTEANQKPHAYEHSISLLTGEFLLHIVREYEMLAIVPSEKSTIPNNLIVAVLGYLSVNYNKASLTETAAFFNYSTAYLSRFIHKNTGKTFNQIITELQMEHAMEMLKKGKTNLTEIALEVGCFDSSHLSKKFKAYYGQSPVKYMN